MSFLFATDAELGYDPKVSTRMKYPNQMSMAAVSTAR